MANAKSTQQSIDFEQMFEDGVCYIGEGLYSKTVSFSDINYQLVSRNEQIDVFTRYCEFLNAFDANVHLQLTVFNRHMDLDNFKNTMLIRNREDGLDRYRQEYNQMLLDKVSVGENSIIREKYITFTIFSETYPKALITLSRIEAEIMTNLKGLGCDVESLSGLQRLELIQRILRPEEQFAFDYSNLIESSLRTKDFIAPNGMDFSNKNRVEIDNNLSQTVAILDTSTELSDRLIADLMEIPAHLTFNLHIDLVEKTKALNLVKQKISFMEQQKVDEQIKARKNGYDVDMIPHELKHSLYEALELLEDLKVKNQKMFKVTVLVNVLAKNEEELENIIFEVSTTANKHNCKTVTLTHVQEKALNATLPVGHCSLEVKRTLTTASTGVFIPFLTQELFQESGSFYGLNSISRNLIFFDRKGLMNSNGWILGTPGSGKSFTAKHEIIKTLLNTNDEVLVIDPEREYTNLANLMNGEIVHISANSKSYINAFDINVDYADEDDPVVLKAEFIVSLFEVLIGGRGGLTSAQKGLIDRAVRLTYGKYFKNLDPNKMPTLKDFHKVLQTQPEGEAKNLALAMEIFVDGSLSVFANQTNIDLDNRFIIFDIKDLGKQLKTMGMLIVLDQIWNRITENRKLGKRTWIYIDEIYILFQNDYSANYLFELYKRARKWGAIPTGITQNVEDLLLSDTARRMLSNSEFIMLLNQAPSDRDKLEELLNLSPQQLAYVTNSSSGNGLLVASKNIIPFDDKFPKHTDLYKVMTTKIEEVTNFSEL